MATGTTGWSYALAATTFPADDTYTLTVRATDAVGNVSTASTAFIMDTDLPAPVGFSTTNYSVAGKLEFRDTYTLYYSEAIDPSSIISGWNGLAPQNVVVRANNITTGTLDTLTVHDSANNPTPLLLGTVQMKGNYVAAPRTFGLTGTKSTLTWNGSSITVTLGTQSGARRTVATLNNMTWTPAAGIKDLFGATAPLTAWNETDNDKDF